MTPLALSTPPDTTALEALERDGIYAATLLCGQPIGALPGAGGVACEARRFADGPQVADAKAEVAAGTRGAPIDYEAPFDGRKDSLVRYRDSHPILADNPLVTMGACPELLDTATAALGCPIRFVSADIWYTLPWQGRQRQWSHNWHRDPDDRRLLKVFLYLSNVTADCGPFSYALGTHLTDFDICPAGQYFPRENFERFPQASARSIIGPAGTLVLANTAGLHCGGYGKMPRLLATWTYTSPDYRGRYFTLDAPPDGASDQQLFALGFLN